MNRGKRFCRPPPNHSAITPYAADGRWIIENEIRSSTIYPLSPGAREGTPPHPSQIIVPPSSPGSLTSPADWQRSGTLLVPGHYIQTINPEMSGSMVWSERGDSNPRPLPWQGSILPLNYSRNQSVNVNTISDLTSCVKR